MQTKSITTYLVTLQRRIDRRLKFLRNIPESIQPICSFNIGGSYDHRDFASDRIPVGIKLFSWKIESENPWWNRSLKFGEIACALNHLACWEHALRKTDIALIFEDDAIVKDWTQVNQALDAIEILDPTWDFLYLGRERIDPDVEIAFDTDFVRPGYCFCTYSYAVSAMGIQKLLSYNFRTIIMPVDEFLPATFVKHPRKDVSAVVLPKLNAYALATDIIFEGSKTEYGSDTEDSTGAI